MLFEQTTLQQNLEIAIKAKGNGYNYLTLSLNTNLPVEDVVWCLKGYHAKYPFHFYEKICKELSIDFFETIMNSINKTLAV